MPRGLIHSNFIPKRFCGLVSFSYGTVSKLCSMSVRVRALCSFLFLVYLCVLFVSAEVVVRLSISVTDMPCKYVAGEEHVKIRALATG